MSVEVHIPLVLREVHRIRQNLPGHVSCEDLVAAGFLALCEADERYDPLLGNEFSTYAVPCIRGAIYDELRKHDHVSKTVRKRLKVIAKAKETLFAEGNTNPSVEELQKVTNYSQKHITKALQEERANFMVEIKPRYVAKTISPYDRLIKAETSELLKKAMLSLDTRERRILQMYHFSKMTFADIADMLRLCKSRVFQLHTKALEKMRTFLVEHGIKEA